MAHTVAVVGLGYVGLPLALAFAKKFDTIGFDLSERKIASYLNRVDPTGEISSGDLTNAKRLVFTTDAKRLAEADFIVVAVPTPIDTAHTPDLEPLRRASVVVGSNMKQGATVIFESTVYPGATEEICVPLLEERSGMTWKTDFNVGYSPERVNPGDKARTVETIVKVVSGDTPQTLEAVAALYESVIVAGVYRASSVQVAEAAKVIENTQRDLNIALMNELSLIFGRLGIDTKEVLQAAGTKWNFLPFTPGLVGGHCIGVDPYYLTHKAEMVGYHPEVILAGRRINDGMAAHVAQQTIKSIIKTGAAVQGARIIVFGLTFKENCKDLRNSKVADLVRELGEFGCEVIVHDPIAEPAEAEHEYGIALTEWDDLPNGVEAVVAAVSHAEYLEAGAPKLLKNLKQGGTFVDVKSAYDRATITDAGYRLWRL